MNEAEFEDCDMLAKEKDELADLLLMDYPVSAKVTASSNVLDEQPDLLDGLAVNPTQVDVKTSDERMVDRVGFNSPFEFDRKLLVKDRPMTV